MMRTLKRMSRFNGSIFFMSRAKYTRAHLPARERACTRRSDEGTEKNVEGSGEQATGDEERKRGKACSRVYGQWLTRQ